MGREQNDAKGKGEGRSKMSKLLNLTSPVRRNNLD
jgi:hypothetical protein